jgi:arabinofuranan 3-O-arabinosyltransferase
VTAADPDRAQLPATGGWHTFGTGGPAQGVVADIATTIPTVRMPQAPASSRSGPWTRFGQLADRWWFLIAFVIALVIFGATDTGRIVFDTKLGVDINAAEFLHRLWTLWNPLEWLGSLQDQYIGYAIPMAPFFLIGQLLHVPIWLTERLWLALLIAVGFTGMIKLARALGVGSNTSRLLAGAVFALWPTFTIAISSTSAAALPGMVVPWALLPLIAAVQGRCNPGRAAARSGLAIAAMAGINAISTIAVLLLPALYILTHTKARQRIALSLQWSIAVITATAWWLIPLLLQGRYSFNFLPYIEQSATTSGTMSAAAVLRGTGTWTAYFNLGGSPWLPAGWTMVTSPGAILASATAAAAGLAGLARRDMPERRWLCGCTGLAVMVALAGYYGPFGGPFHAAVDGLLNGALAPFRSTYKLEPVLAVTLALGCAHVTALRWRLSVPLGRSARIGARAAMAPLAALVLVGLALPQLTGTSLEPGSFVGLPRYWSQAAQFLSAHSLLETALVVPANPHGQFSWGNTIDDPLEPLASSPWVERGLVPFGGAGSQVLLETAELAVESGQQVRGLDAYLARAGIRYVVVRNDTNPAISGYTAPQVVNETLALSGFHRVAAFGPLVGAAPGYPNLPGQAPGFALTYPAIEIFTADNPRLRPASPVAALPVSSTVLVNGGPDSLLQLAGQGTLRTQPTVIAGQRLAGHPALWAVTDGQRRTDNAFGSTSDFQSYAYTSTEKNPVDDPLGGAGGPPRQLLPVPAAGHQTVAVLSGAASVTASSAGTWLGESPQYDPVNAFDGNPATAWAESSPVTPVGQWIQVNFDHVVNLPARAGIELLVDSSARSVANQLLVTTAAGSATTKTVSAGAEQPLRLPPGPTHWLRITITGASNVVPGDPGAGISEVVLPGLRVTRVLQPAEDPAGASAAAVAYSFAQQVPSPYSQAGQAAGQDLNRQFVTSAASRLTSRITAVPVPGPGLETLITKLSPAAKSDLLVTASSTWNSLPTLGPGNLFAKAPGKPWLAGANDPSPTIAIKWHGRRTIRELVLQPAYGLAAAPTGVLIGSPAGGRLASVGPGGIVPVSPPLRTDRLYLAFNAASSSAAGNTAAGQPNQLPLGLAALRIPALSGLHVAVPKDSAPFRLACGYGPAVSVAGHRYRTSVTGTIGDLVRLEPVRLRICSQGGTVAVPAGLQRLSAAPSSHFVITSLSLSGQRGSGASASASQSRRLLVRTWQADNRMVAMGPGRASYLEIHENANPGWIATMDGHRLTAATLDGWQQAFVVPAGRGGVITLTYAPTSIYHAAIIGSGIALLILLGLAIGTGRKTTAYTMPRLALGGGGQLTNRHGRHRAGVHGFAHHPAPVSWRRVLVTSIPVAVVVAVTGGLIAFVVPVLAAINNWRARWLPVIAACAMFTAGVVAAAARTPNVLGSGPFSGPAQVCALVALAAALMPSMSAEPGESAPSNRSQE